MNIVKINVLSPEEAQQSFFRCCSSLNWAQKMTDARPFKNESELFSKAHSIWNACSTADYLEAFSHHPRIGGNIIALREKWCASEQNGVNGASEEILQSLSTGNEDYEQKFGFVFLICATGKTAAEMLSALVGRYPNSRDEEIENAKVEQSKITEIRLKKLLGES